ncbi:hypothetical protein MPDQ_004459 [Monascus purpureus]|uniref:Uncharacterized protein n=1 Tax=Monascus purpureus TaxID=5098 RepID=A0A507QY64_MONPU|nr:hypothetical protein MPDQ_004459 [Monascus purpureus]BDD62699.1 hypothetical protein MAP00_007659 [Monascus purpureus]
MEVLSLPGYNVSSWYSVGSRGTVMVGLIESGVYNETELFYSDNLQKIIQNRSTFYSPWLYRMEFDAGSKFPDGMHLYLTTHGITAQADIFVNGALVASHKTQQGSFVGWKYDIAASIREGLNCILIKTYPASYHRDFAIGFADWNPYPPDNGTGVWRNVELSASGAVSISPPRVITTFQQPDASQVDIIVTAEITNHQPRTVVGMVTGVIESENKDQVLRMAQFFMLNAHESRSIALTTKLDKPHVWWPASWGEQPLYTVLLNVTTVDNHPSNVRTRSFGIRHVTSHLNSYNDREFTVNGYPFQVLGAGYSPDIFLRFDENRVRKIFKHALNMGLNTVRLEGKLEQPELYELADRMGIMVLPGWECCDKWEAFDYNDDNKALRWDENDYTIAENSMRHEAMQLQNHPSVLAFLVGSDYWPDDTATEVYLSALRKMDWQAPIIASASKRGSPKQLEGSGMKMVGPYDWVPPNYWYESEEDAEGGAFGFGSELGAGVGTPELSSLRKFLSPKDLEDLWTNLDKGLFHMSNDDSQFWQRSIYNKGLVERYGQPSSLEDYVLKAQVMDYEATRAQFEAFSIRQSAQRPATGMIYWMLNSAWPNLHWQLFDYYLNAGGAYFGAKVGCRTEHVAYDYVSQGIYIINHTKSTKANRTVTIDLIDMQGRPLFHHNETVVTSPLSSTLVSTIPEISQTVFLRLILQNSARDIHDDPLSRNIYWLSENRDVLDSENATWYSTPVLEYADYTALSELEDVTVKGRLKTRINQDYDQEKDGEVEVFGLVDLQNESDSLPAFFVRMILLDAETQNEVLPVYWSDNHVTLWPGESLNVSFTVELKREIADSGLLVAVDGWNVERFTLDTEGDA